MDDLGLLLAVAAALPRVHRPPVTDFFRRSAGGAVEGAGSQYMKLAIISGSRKSRSR